MDNIKKYIFDQVAANRLAPQEATQLLKELRSEKEESIAVIGMSCKLPGANNVSEYWNNLVNGVNCMSVFPEERKKYLAPIRENPHFSEFVTGAVSTPEDHTKADNNKAGYLSDIDMFDAEFFNIPPREAKYIDSVQRVFLQTAWSAIEDAGYGGNKIYGSNTGVYVGKDNTGSTFYRWLVEGDPMLFTGTWEGILASRISYLFNMRGPAMVVDTACSSGLVAIHNACKALLNKECEMALAGGVALGSTPQSSSDDEDNNSVISSVQADDGIVRTFDKRSSGTIFGEGVGAILLKPLSKALEDGDNIYAIIKGSALNNDGASNGITAPNPRAQEDLFCKAWEDAKINPETIAYIEAHGTGTALGDPIEVKGLTGAFGRYTNHKQFCGIGSVKTNMGHLIGASGLAGIIKVILSLQQKTLLPMINFSEPNPHINFPNSPLYVSDTIKEWKEEDYPRRAGVNAFGFSGTNAHIVVEEAPVSRTRSAEELYVPQVFAISAKSESVLAELVRNYDQFLRVNNQLNLADVCYTANTGRGHYSHRLIMIVNDLADLKKKITAVNLSGLRNTFMEGLWYAKHQIVSDKRKVQDSGEISESQKRGYDIEFKKRLDTLLELNGSSYENFLNELCGYYIKGAHIDWETMYSANKRRKVSLPVYPYEKIPYWAEIRKSSIKNTINAKEIMHPLLDRLAIHSISQDIYTVQLGVDTHWVLKDHKILGNHVIPGTAYIDLLRTLGQIYFVDTAVELRDIQFFTPLSVDEAEPKEAQIIVTKQDDYYNVVVASLLPEDDDRWVVHVEGKIYGVEPGEPEVPFYSVETILEYGDLNPLNLDFSLISDTQSELVAFGPRWFNVKGAYKGEQHLVVHLDLPNEFIPDLDIYHFHPSLLDNALNTGINAFGDGIYLPFSYGCFKVYNRMPSSFYSYATRKNRINSSLETMEFDICLLDENGAVFAEIKDYRVKKVNQIDAANYKRTYYKPLWKNKELESSEDNIHGSVVVFKDEYEFSNRLIEALRSKGCDIIEVQLGEESFKINDNMYVIDGSEESYQEIVDKCDQNQVNQFIHLLTLNEQNEVNTFEQLMERKRNGLDSLFFLTRAVSRSKQRNEKFITLVSDYVKEVTGDEHSINPHHAAFFGLGKVVPYENLNMFCKTIDIDDDTSIESIVHELSHPKQESNVAYRKDVRYIEELNQVSIPAEAPNELSIVEDGVYVITGGNSGIGLEVAKHLAAKKPVKLCLLSRSIIPEKDKWAEIIASDEENSLVHKVKALQEIEASGSFVHCYQANIGKMEEIEAALTIIKEHHGTINGIFHCAGLPGDGFILRKEKAIFDEVVLPKFEGTWLLDNLTRELDLDFLVLFSSMTSIVGAPGQGDYAAANAYMDAYSMYRNKLGKRTLAINWSAWTETGMVTHLGITKKDVLFKSLRNREGLEILDELMKYNVSNVITGEMNYELANFTEIESVIGVSKKIKKNMEKSSKKRVRGSNKKNVRTTAEIDIKGKAQGEYTEMEKILASLYATVLELDEIDIYSNFNDLGGDSIMATEVSRIIDEHYPNKVDISDVFTYSSISDMAEYLGTRLEV
ncbi:type I polyketide synthase [Paenibacillus monticola]|uniref:SDR family NAD(P)-dependent oxidoreductase n=1 Tax=Paenibacillus monticola TaxID=2666075 RepID=A0A7X2H3Y2_9BACL|nr:type I polyketide synthase [Paenibacillus monticola]MRN52278.1 SDR family NAD(P)-dependent oxidoreductase [Paenibacillus monticola]